MDPRRWVSSALWSSAVLVVVVVLIGRPGWAQDACDQCDCKLSSNEDERAIFNVRSARCRAGSLQWSSAYGAVRLEVRPPPHHQRGGSRRDHHRLCLVVRSHHTRTQVSLETPQVDPLGQVTAAELKNYRLRTTTTREEERGEASGSSSSSSSSRGRMRSLVSTAGTSREVCVVAGGAGRAWLLYVEVERSHEFTGVPSVTLQYDLQPLPGGGGEDGDALRMGADPMEECRPCTQEELLEAYCTSDFVAVGSILQTRQAGDEDQGDLSQVEVSVAQLLHQTSPIFRRQRRHDPHLRGLLHAPARCGIRPSNNNGKGNGKGGGGGHLLITGRMRLGKARLGCAPYLDEWLKISYLAECVYD